MAMSLLLTDNNNKHFDVQTTFEIVCHFWHKVLKPLTGVVRPAALGLELRVICAFLHVFLPRAILFVLWLAFCFEFGCQYQCN